MCEVIDQINQCTVQWDVSDCSTLCAYVICENQTYIIVQELKSSFFA